MDKLNYTTEQKSIRRCIVCNEWKCKDEVEKVEVGDFAANQTIYRAACKECLDKIKHGH